LRNEPERQKRAYDHARVERPQGIEGFEYLSPAHPLLYEIDTRCWLASLSERTGSPVTLRNVPEAESSRWRQLGFTHIWLMGVWTTGALSRAHALADARLHGVCNQALPGWREGDLAGSPYAIADYQVPAALGGEEGLRKFRERLNASGLKLVLDFVPNHVALDHPWAVRQPELFVQSPADVPGAFRVETPSGVRWLAHGRDPNFPPWTDTLQLDFRRPDTRAAVIGLLRSVARRCDGVRCDMAMLPLNDVFARTWDPCPTAGAAPVSEFWADAIAAVRADRGDFLFLAEAYWGLEPRLHALGFDFTYDKHVYDCIVSRHYNDLRRHLLEAPPGFVAHGAHFLENHDERRIAGILTPAEHRAAALLILGLPGMRFLHDGQLAGARICVPVQLARRPHEPTDPEIVTLYDWLLARLKDSDVGREKGELLWPQPAWDNNPTDRNFIVIQWTGAAAGFNLVVINLAPHRGQCRVPLAVARTAREGWEFRDLLGNEAFQRRADELASTGLFLDLPGHGTQLLDCKPAANS
jgi:hypothetical protein